MDIRPQVTTQISKSFLVEYTEFIEELDGGGRKKILIKDWEYFKDKLSMCQMALFPIHKKRLEEHYQILMELRLKDKNFIT